MFVTVFDRACLLIERLATLCLSHREAMTQARLAPLAMHSAVNALYGRVGPMPTSDEPVGVPLDPQGRDVPGSYHDRHGAEAIR